ncbi:MAG TPA: APC family permease [Polyangiaceae bacterium]
MRRALTTFDATCIGINAIVGSGIYLFPGKLAEALGPAAILAWVLTGVLCLPLAFTFASLGAGEDRAGGAFRYVERAFGTAPAFVVGWSAWVTSVVSWAAVANGAAGYAAGFLALSPGEVGLRALAAAIVLALTTLNVFGVKPGARVTDVLTVGKLIPLLVFVVVGAWFLEPARFTPFAPHGYGAMPALALMTMFAYQGFEVVGIPAGELRDPRRSVPRAVVGSLLASALLYALVQIVFVGTGATSSAQALPDAARGFLGPFGATLLALGGMLSMLGFNAGTALCTPRYLEALAEERLVPALLARQHARYDTPHLAIVASGSVAALLAVALDFEHLVDLAVIAVLVQYFASALALVRLGRTRSQKVLGLGSAAVSVAFAIECDVRALLLLLPLIAAGGAVALVTRVRSRAAR